LVTLLITLQFHIKDQNPADWPGFLFSAYLIGTYNPNKGCEGLTQRRKGTEKARKENHFKSDKNHPLRLF